MLNVSTRPDYRHSGVVIAGTIIGAWCTTFLIAMFGPMPWAALTFPALTFLSTGMFITAHDSMHGLVAPRSRRTNAVFGRIALALYALFSFSALIEEHRKHHARPGHPEEDPDFHDGNNDSFIRWYLRFLSHYVTLRQVIGMAIIFNLLHHVAGVGIERLLLLWVLPLIVSTLQLFYFGTFLPHRSFAPGDPHRATTVDYPPWLSFLTCYHFGYHWEHHAFPFVPWWRLPSVRRANLESRVAPDRGARIRTP